MTVPEPLAPEPRATRRGSVIALMAAVVAAVSLLSWWMTRDEAEVVTTSEAVEYIDPDWRAPADVRIRVRVLNGTQTRGLARRVTNYIRDLGFDVVDYDSAREPTDISTVTFHSGQREWAEKLALALSIDSIAISDDTSRFVDVTVVVGRNWQPPTSQPLRP